MGKRIDARPFACCETNAWIYGDNRSENAREFSDVETEEEDEREADGKGKKKTFCYVPQTAT